MYSVLIKGELGLLFLSLLPSRPHTSLPCHPSLSFSRISLGIISMSFLYSVTYPPTPSCNVSIRCVA